MTSKKITTETVQRIADEFLGARISPPEQEQVAGLLNALLVDMATMRRMDVGTAEPATLYSAMN